MTIVTKDDLLICSNAHDAAIEVYMLALDVGGIKIFGGFSKTQNRTCYLTVNYQTENEWTIEFRNDDNGRALPAFCELTGNTESFHRDLLILKMFIPDDFEYVPEEELP